MLDPGRQLFYERTIGSRKIIDCLGNPFASLQEWYFTGRVNADRRRQRCQVFQPIGPFRLRQVNRNLLHPCLQFLSQLPSQPARVFFARGLPLRQPRAVPTLALPSL